MGCAINCSFSFVSKPKVTFWRNKFLFSGNCERQPSGGLEACHRWPRTKPRPISRADLSPHPERSCLTTALLLPPTVRGATSRGRAGSPTFLKQCHKVPGSCCATYLSSLSVVRFCSDSVKNICFHLVCSQPHQSLSPTSTERISGTTSPRSSKIILRTQPGAPVLPWASLQTGQTHVSKAESISCLSNVTLPCMTPAALGAGRSCLTASSHLLHPTASFLSFT